MNKVLLVIGIIVLIAIAAFIGILVQAGLFYTVQVTEGMSGPYTLVYLEQTGNYSKAGDTGMKVYQDLVKDFGITTTKGFGIYLDDPKTVPEAELRSEVGCILEGDDVKKITLLKSKFKVKNLDAKKSMIASHPFNNPFSIMLGITKVYPLFAKTAAIRKSEFTVTMEIYDMPAKKIIYIMR